MAVRNENSARLAHLLEMTIAVGVLAAVLIPALVIPAVQAARQVSAGERKKKEEPNLAVEALTARLNCAKQLRGVEAEPVSAEFATEAVHRLSDRFEISRQMVIARRNVTDADVEELVRYMKMGEAPWKPGRSTELLGWEWLIYCDSVNLSGSQVTDAAVERLAALPQIQDLNLADTRISDEALVYIGRLPALFQLDLSGTSVTDEGLCSLTPCRKIECLDLSNTQIGDEGLVAFRDHQKLTSLYLANSKVTGASLELMSSLKSLQDLNLDYCSIENQDDIRFLTSLEQLTSLSMQHTQVGDEGAVLLSEIEGLWDLHLEGTRIGRTGRVALKAGLPECALSL